jgi:hypothetical protein
MREDLVRVAGASILFVLGMLAGAAAVLTGWQGAHFVRLAMVHQGVGVLIQLALVLAAVVLPLSALILAAWGFLAIRSAIHRLGHPAAHTAR